MLAFAEEMHLMGMEHRDQEHVQNSQKSWDTITEANRKSAADVIGYRDPRKCDITMVVKMFREQKELGVS